MKLTDLQKPIEDQSNDELIERLRQIRHNRFVERPAIKAREAKEEAQEQRRESKKSGTKMEKMLASLTDEQRAALIQQLSGDTGGIQTEGNQA